MSEEKEVNVLITRCYKGKNEKGKEIWRYNDYFVKDSRWYEAVTKFTEQASPLRNETYDYWIQTGVRWLFEKHKNSSSWSDAVIAYNGSGTDAVNYKNTVYKYMKDAENANKLKEEYIPPDVK
jgi:hypothetical protein